MVTNNDSDRYRYIRDHQKHSSFLFTWAIWWTDQSRLSKISYLSSVSLAICSIAYFPGLFFLVPIGLSAVTLLWGVLETLGSDIRNSIKTAEELDQEFQKEFDIEKGKLKQNIQNHKKFKQEKDSSPAMPKTEIDSGIKKQEVNIEDKQQFIGIKEKESIKLIDRIEESTTSLGDFVKKIDDFNSQVDEKDTLLGSKLVSIEKEGAESTKEHKAYIDDITADNDKMLKKIEARKARKAESQSNSKITYFTSVDAQKSDSENNSKNENNLDGTKFC
tara:strand:+ start:2935 stop:3759 length:825 start_codon:yes stop_codon:yes gene_type:complete